MDYGRVANSDGYYQEGGTGNILLFAVQILQFLIALVGFSLCIWIRFDLDFWEWCLEIGWYTYWNCTYVIMIAMLLKAALLMTGGWALYSESRAMCLLCIFLHPLMFILHLTGTILICMYGVEESAYLTSELEEVLFALVFKWDEDPRASRILKQIMEYVGCCGATGGGDFPDNFKPIPYECRHPITGNEWDNGCGQQIAIWLEPWTAPLAGMGVFFCLADMIMTYLYVRIRRSIVKDQL